MWGFKGCRIPKHLNWLWWVALLFRVFAFAVGSVCALTYQGSLMARSAIFMIFKIVEISWTSSLVSYPMSVHRPVGGRFLHFCPCLSHAYPHYSNDTTVSKETSYNAMRQGGIWFCLCLPIYLRTITNTFPSSELKSKKHKFAWALGRSKRAFGML